MDVLRTCGMSLLLCFLLTLRLASAVDWDVKTALDTYVHSDDGFYSWELLATYRYENLSCTLHVVNMTSQKWMDETYVDRPYWWHFMSIGVPDEANLTYPDAAFMIINGGGNDNDDEPPPADDGANVGICTAAIDAGSVGGIISQIPNQPLYFKNDPTNEERSEDEIIAWTWRTYIDDPAPDPTVIARFPMTKAAKRGLDTINEVAMQYHSYTNVTRFAPIGASKRGWTTWSLAATDQRVIAMAPLVFSMLKMNETLMVHYQALGGWSFAFEPYHTENLTRELLTDKAQEAFMYEDMWNYRERYTIPLLQMVSTGDEFFLLQDSHQWWDDIPDPKWTCMFENAEHSMFPHYAELYETVLSFWISVLSETKIPTVTWDRGETADGGFIDYYVDIEPEEITVFRAATLRNDTIRDFRLAHIDPEDGEIAFHPVLWTEFNSTLEHVSTGHYRATVEKVDGEWVGFVVRGMWRGPDGKRLFLTSETQIVPDTFPVEPCFDADSCYGTLV